MATTLLSDMENAQKVIFAESVVENYVADSELMDWFETDLNVQTDITTGGRYVETGQYFNLPGATGARADDDYIPVPEPPDFENSRIYLKKQLGSLEMSGDTMRRVASSVGAFVDWAERSLTDLATRVKNDLDRQYAGYGFGIKARVNGIVTDLGGGKFSFAVDSSLGVPEYTDAWLQFLEGETIVFSSNATGTGLRNAGTTQAAKVIDLDEDTNTLICTADATLIAAIQDNDYIANGDRSGVSFPTAAGVNRELQGLLAAVDDGGIIPDYNNITRDDHRLWRSIVIDANNGTFNGQNSPRLLNYVDEQVRTRGAGRVNGAIFSLSGARSYWLSVESSKMFVDPRGNYTDGKGNLSVILTDRTIPLRVARKLPPQVAFLVQRDTFKRITLGKWEWDDKTGSIWRPVTDANGRKDSYYSVGYAYEELYNVAPRKNARIEGLLPVT